MNPWPRDLGGATVVFHAANAKRLRAETRVAICTSLWRKSAAAARYAVAPFAFALRKCSSSRGKISTKLHGR